MIELILIRPRSFWFSCLVFYFFCYLFKSVRSVWAIMIALWDAAFYNQYYNKKKLYYHKLFASSYFHCWFANSSLLFQRIVTLEMSLQRRKTSNIRINRPWMWRIKTEISFKNILIKMMLLSKCDQHFKSVTDWWLYFLP